MDPQTNDLTSITREIKGIEEKIIPLLTTQSEEIARHGETATATSKQLKELEEKYDARMLDLDAARDEITELKKDMSRDQLPGAGARSFKTAGMSFTESEQFRGASESQPETGEVAVKSFFSNRKALFTDDALGQVDAHVYDARRLSGIHETPAPDMHIRDLLNVTAITEGLVHYIERTEGRWVAEIQSSEGDKKKEQQLNLTVKQAGPVTIAHWLPITKQAYRRAPQLRTYIDQELITGVRLAEDVELLYGAGGTSLQGLMTNPAVQDYNAAGRSQTGDTRIDTLRRAITLIRSQYYRPTGMIVNQNDWEAIELQKDSQNRYLWVTVPEGGVQRLWRVPVIDTPAIFEDEFLVGDFRIGANLWDLESANVSIGWVNDDFIRNQLAILGEEDIIFTTEHPKAFVKGDFGAVSS